MSGVVLLLIGVVSPGVVLLRISRYAGALPPSGFDASRRVRGRPAVLALKVSYASTDVARDARFYVGLLGAREVLAVADAPSGEARRAFWFDGDNADSVEVHVVSHDAPAAATAAVADAAADEKTDDDSELGGAWSVARLESYAGALHAAEMGASHTRGSDALLDNHFGRRLGRSGEALDGLVGRLNATASTPFRLWRQTNNNTRPPSVGYFVYAAAPGGNAVQVVGTFDGAAPAGIEEWSSCLV